MAHVEEHLGAVAAARSHLSGKGAQPLGPLPEGFAATRAAMHAVAEGLLKPKRELETGNEIALRFCEGGFGTATWHRDEPGAEPGHVRVEGTELVLDEGGRETRLPVEEHARAAQLLGVPAPEIPEVSVDDASAAAIADWFAFGTVVLADLIERNPGNDADPIRLWPEHFDVATVLGPDERRRASELRRLAGRRGPRRALPLRRPLGSIGDRGELERCRLRRRGAGLRRAAGRRGSGGGGRAVHAATPRRARLSSRRRSLG